MRIVACLFLVSSPALASETITYTYDVHGRVVEVKHSGGANGTTEIDYTYDKADNRSQVVVTNSPNPPPP